MTKKADIIQAWQDIPPEEKAQFKRYLKGERVWDAGLYGFTGESIMERGGGTITLRGLDYPITIAALRGAVPLS